MNTGCYVGIISVGNRRHHGAWRCYWQIAAGGGTLVIRPWLVGAIFMGVWLV